MDRTKVREVLQENPLLAILRNVPKEMLIPYVKSIANGGVYFFEVALNSENALEEIRILRDYFGERAYIGAGTAITVEKAEQAMAAGAEFLLSPSTDEPVLAYCRDKNIAIIPGVFSPSDVSKCMFYGCMNLKLFPAGTLPCDYVKSLKGPLSETEYMAIGGVSETNVQDFIRAGYLAVGMGSNLIPAEIVKAQDWDRASAHVAAILEKINSIKR